MKKLLTLCIFLMISQVWAQKMEVSGNVTDESGQPLPGASVQIKNTKKGVTTDFDGNYKIQTDVGAILVFSYVGFATQEIKVTQATINVQLKQGENLEAVTIVAYGGAVNSAKVSSAIATLEGHASGISIRGYSSGSSVVGELPTPKEKAIKKVTQNQIQSGQLTAGEINDINDWDEWKTAINKEEYQYFQEKWNFHLQRKVLVEVKNELEKPVNNVKVSIYTETNKKIMSARTDVTGKAFVFLDFNEMTSDDYYRIQLEYDGKIKGKKVTKLMNQVNFVVNTQKETNSIDIMFTIDATGSMGDEINYLKAELHNIMDRVSLDKNIAEKRVALTFYRDKGDEYVVREYDFETDISQVQNSLNENNANGGGDYEEALEIALETANKLTWNVEAKSRLMFLILDAPPHFTEETVSKIKQQIILAQEKGIKIIPIVASGANKNLEFLMRFFSISTNGTYVFLTDDSGIGNPHLKPTKDTYTVEKLNDLIVRLIKQSVSA